MDKKISKKLTIIMSLLIIFIFALILIPKFFQNDLFFDLKTADSILKYGIDFKDHFSFIPNLTYIYHHYLYDLMIYPIYNIFGYNGIFVLFLIIFSLFGVCVFYVNNKITDNKIVSVIVSIMTLLGCSYAFQSRVQSITYILFFLEVYFINKLYDTGKKKYSIYILIISILIANMHMPLWIFSVVLFLPFIFEFLVKHIVDKFKLGKFLTDKIVIKYPKNKKIILVTFVLLLLSGLVTPLKLYPYTFFTKSLFNNTYSFIGEMQKTVLIDNIYGLYLILLLIIIMCIKDTKIKLRDLTLAIGLFLFMLIAVRNIVYLNIFYLTIIVKIVYESFKVPKLKFNLFKNIDKNIIYRFACIWLVWICAWLVCAYGYLLYKVDFKNNDYGINDGYPVSSVNYIKKNLDYKNIKIYNEFNYGSYLEFNDIPVFVDSRAEVYIKEFNGGYDIINDFLDADNISRYKDVFNKYEFDYALVYKGSNLYEFLNEDSDFKLIFEEDDYSLFELNEK